jgi:hypothetical protein
MIWIITIIGNQEEKTQEKQQEYICLSFANYCLEVHELTPTHETYELFMKQEKLFPEYYKKHIYNAQMEHDSLYHHK